jgi:molybdopterin-guanine dinucleotide biosynthesis protein A
MTQGSRQGNGGRVGGLVLAGGRSSRFGSEKAIALLDGTPLLSRLARELSRVCEAVAVSAAPGSGAAALAHAMGLEAPADDPADAKGPLAGVAAGLAWAGERGFDRLVTVPCDTPLIGLPEISALLASLGDAAAAYAVTDDGPQPLCAVWRTDLESRLRARLRRGEHPSVRQFVAEIAGVALRFDDPEPFRNANTPAALLALSRSLDSDQ